MIGQPKQHLLQLLTALFLFTSSIVGCQSSDQQPDSEKSGGRSAENSETEAASDSQSDSPLTSQLNNFFDKARNNQQQPSSLTGELSSNGDVEENPSADEINPVAKNPAGTEESPSPAITMGSEPSNDTDPVSDQSSDQTPGDAVDVNRLLARIGELTEVQRTAESTDQIKETLIEQADLAKQIYDSTSSFPFKVTAVRTRIHALTILDRLKVETAKEDLERFCESLLEQSEPEMKRMGLIGLVSAQLRNYLSTSSESDFQAAVKVVDQYTQENFDDLAAGTELTAAASQLFKSRKREKAIELMSVLSRNFGKSNQPEIIDLTETLNAQMALASAEFDKAITKQVADEDGNLDQLDATMDEIVKSGITLGLYNELIGWMQLFEREACYKSIDLIAEKLQTGFREKAKDDPERYIQALDSLDLVRQRMALVGKPFSFEGVELANGQPFHASDVQDKIVLISFWSGQATKEDRLQLQFETKNYEHWRTLGIAMVGFNMDADPQAAKDFFGSNPPRWMNTKSADDAALGFESEFAKRSVADTVPYRILLDHEGNVAFVAVPFEAIGTRMNALLRKKPVEE